MTSQPVLKLCLRLISDDKETLVGEDASGTRRQFQKKDLKSIIFDRANEAVDVSVTPKALATAKKITVDISPEAELGIKRIERPCMSCKHPFMAHPSIHVCTPCKQTSVWGSGGDYSVAL